MKKLLFATLAFFLLVCLAGCTEKSPEPEPENTGGLGGSGNLLPNPFVYVESLKELNAASEIKFESLPDNIGSVYEPAGYAYSETLHMAQVLYADPGDSDNTILIRKAPYELTDQHTIKDISGDFSNYEEYAEVDGIDFAYSRAGNKGLINNVQWQSPDYLYAMIINPGTDQGLTEETVIDLVRTIR